MVNIKHYLVIKAAPGTVYQAITQEEGLKAWWTPTTKAAPEEGAILEFKFGERYHDRMKLMALEKNHSRDPGRGHLLVQRYLLAGPRSHAHQRILLGHHRGGYRAFPGCHAADRGGAGPAL